MGEIVEFPRRPERPRQAQPEPLWREAVGAELRRERLEQRRTLAEVATPAGVSVQHLSEVERGLKEPSSEVLGAVAGSLGLRLADLTGRVTRSIRPVRDPGPVALAA